MIAVEERAIVSIMKVISLSKSSATSAMAAERSTLNVRVGNTLGSRRKDMRRPKKKHYACQHGRRRIKALKRQVKKLAQKFLAHNVQAEAPDAVLIYRSELDMIKNLTMEYPRSETGGKFYGFFTENGWPVIALVVGPGPGATHEYTRFVPDKEAEGAIAQMLVASGASHVGSFHSHHILGLNAPSGIDVGVMQDVFDDATPPKRGFLCGIATIEDGVPVLNLYYFNKVGERVQYHALPIRVCEMKSPMRAGLEAIVREGGAL